LQPLQVLGISDMLTEYVSPTLLRTKFQSTSKGNFGKSWYQYDGGIGALTIHFRKTGKSTKKQVKMKT
jgi:hypothetical protein